MLKEKIKLLLTLLIDLTIVALEIYCLINFLSYFFKGNHDIRFRYFTNISNLFVGLISLVDFIILITSLIKKKEYHFKIFSIIKFIGVSMTTLTFIVVLIATPFIGFRASYSGIKIITHLIVPLLIAISFLFISKDEQFEWKYSLLGIVPPISYSIIYIFNVIILNNWPDIYKINKDGFWYIYILISILLGFLLSEGLYFLKKKI